MRMKQCSFEGLCVAPTKLSLLGEATPCCLLTHTHTHTHTHRVREREREREREGERERERKRAVVMVGVFGRVLQSITEV